MAGYRVSREVDVCPVPEGGRSFFRNVSPKKFFFHVFFFFRFSSAPCSVRRTKVIDDESDYFAADSKWLNEKERKVLKEKEERLHQLKHRSRREMKVTLDFAGRRITEDGVADEIDGKVHVHCLGNINSFPAGSVFYHLLWQTPNNLLAKREHPAGKRLTLKGTSGFQQRFSVLLHDENILK